MKRTTLIFSAFVLVSLTVVSGIVHGMLSNRWGAADQLVEAGNELELLKTEFGDWEMQAEEDVRQSVQAMLECTGYVNRTYINTKTSDVVRVSVIVGPHGPLSVHTPEICYTSREYRPHPQGDRQRIEVGPQNEAHHKFWALTLQSRRLDGGLLRVCYAWSTGNTWEAPEDARFAYPFEPVLYKVQLAYELPLGSHAVNNRLIYKFLQDFLPTVGTVMCGAIKDRDH